MRYEEVSYVGEASTSRKYEGTPEEIARLIQLRDSQQVKDSQQDCDSSFIKSDQLPYTTELTLQAMKEKRKD